MEIVDCSNGRLRNSFLSFPLSLSVSVSVAVSPPPSICLCACAGVLFCLFLVLVCFVCLSLLFWGCVNNDEPIYVTQPGKKRVRVEVNIM